MKSTLLLLCIFVPHLLLGQLTHQLQINESTISFEKWGEFDKIEMGDDYLRAIGKPELPIAIKSFVVPNDVDVSNIRVEVSAERKLDGSYYVYPAQPPRTVGDIIAPFVEPATIYQTDSIYPADTAVISADRVIQGYHVITVSFYPVTYIPIKKELYVRDITITLNYSASNRSIRPQPNISYNRALLAKGYVKSMVENPEAVDLYADDSNVIPQKTSLDTDLGNVNLRSVSVLEQTIPDYVIITCDSLKESFKPLADWKTKSGTPTTFKTVEEIDTEYNGSDLTEKIRNYLTEAKSRWNGNSLFVLLGGDTDIVPTRLASGTENDYYGADLYYVADSIVWDISNSELTFPFNYIASTYVGRIPTRTKQETSRFITKLLTYEKASDSNVDYSYFENSLIAHAFLDGPKYNTGAYMDEIWNYCKNRNNNYWYLFDHFNCKNELDHNFKFQYIINQGSELSRNNFLSTLQYGMDNHQFNFVYHLDHSEPTNLGSSWMDKGELILNADIDNLPDTHYPKVFLSSGCHPARFDKDCIAEHLLKKEHGGAVAFMGNTDVGWYYEHVQLNSFLNTIFSQEATCKEQYSLGYAHSKLRKYNYWRMHLLGDPSMLMWTSTPKELQVSITPYRITNGLNEITVAVTNLPSGEPALICLQKNDEAYATRIVTNSSPQKFTFTPKTSGVLSITVTAHNYRPLERYVRVYINENPEVYIDHLTFNDGTSAGSIGNTDGNLDAGETIALSIDIKNGSKTKYNSIVGVLTCNSNDITILRNSVKYVGAPSNGLLRPMGDFIFQINKNTPEIKKADFDAIKFTLQMTDGTQIINTDTFKIDVHAPDIKLGEQTCMIAPSGEMHYMKVNLTNMGKGTATGLSATLTSTHPLIKEITQAVSAYPDISWNETQSNNIDFAFRLNSTRLDASTNFALKITNRFGKEWNFPFQPGDRGAQINKNNIIITPTTNSIKLHWNEMTNTRYNVYRSDTGINGVYSILNKQPLSLSYFEDTDVQPFKTYYYKVTGVSLSENPGTLSDPVKAMMCYPLVKNFPRTLAYQAIPQGSINLGDINDDGRLEIFYLTNKAEDGIGQLIGLTCDGKEILNNNPEAMQGMGSMTAKASAIPAIGDIKGDGEYAVVTPTIKGSDEGNTITSFSVYDKDSDGKADKYWETEVQARGFHGVILDNIDNSADGTLEVIQKGGGDTPVRIWNSNGNLKYQFGQGQTYSAPAVADLDNDGDKEIIVCNDNSGISVYHHDGTLFGSSDPFWGAGIDLSSSPVVCDLNKDGKKDIIVAQKRSAQSHIYAISADGNQLPGWDGTQSIPYSTANGSGLDHMISVGDINGDGKLEVVALGTGIVKAWKNTGEELFHVKARGLLPDKQWSGNTSMAVLGDVDGDGIADIVYANSFQIHALHADGNEILGFPLCTNMWTVLNICIDDIDADGKNEIIATDFCSYVYAWKTNGKSSAVEWSSERNNSHNTGEYGTFCKPELILSDTNWNGITPCGNIIVKSGNFTLTNGQTLNLNPTSKVILRSGGTLTIDGATINNAYIWAQSGSKIVIKNDGIINLRNSSNFIIDIGATLDYQQGSIMPNL